MKVGCRKDHGSSRETDWSVFTIYDFFLIFMAWHETRVKFFISLSLLPPCQRDYRVLLHLRE